MTITPKALFTGGQAPGSATTIYTCPANTRAVVTDATFTNTDTANRALTVYVVRNGGSAGPANVLINALAIAPSPPYVSQELVGQTLGPGDTLQWFADVGSKITCAGINGFEQA